MLTHKTVEKKRNQKIGVKMMKTDIEIAQAANPLKIGEIAQAAGVDEKYLSSLLLYLPVFAVLPVPEVFTQ